MTNSQIIYNAAQAHGFTEEQLTQLLDAYKGDLPFHTVLEWNKRGFSVKAGEKALFTADLWKYTDKPSKATREAAEENGEEAPEVSGHYYKKLSYLFSFSQVEAVPQAPGLQAILDKFQNVPGLTLKVNGAQTAAPVVWLSGDTEPHAEAIRATGGHWSNKKQAYFFKPTPETKAPEDKPQDKTPEAAPAPERDHAPALDRFFSSTGWQRCKVYTIRKDKGETGPSVHRENGYTDGVFSYYKLSKTWWAIHPVYGLAVCNASSRQAAQVEAQERAAMVASFEAKPDDKAKRYAAMITAAQENDSAEDLPF